MRNGRFGDLMSPMTGVWSDDSREGSTGIGLAACGEALPFVPNRIRFDRWSGKVGASSLNVWARLGGESDETGLNGGNMVVEASGTELLMSPEKLGLANVDTEGEG